MVADLGAIAPVHRNPCPSRSIYMTLKFFPALIMTTALSVGTWLMPSLQPRAIAQLPDGISQEETAAAEQEAIQMLRNDPQRVLQLVQTTLEQNPQLVQYLMQNPQLVQQLAGQSGDLMQELQQHPELLEQLEQLIQPSL